MSSKVRTRLPAPMAVVPDTDPEVVSRYLEDAAHYPGGRAIGVLRPRNVDELSSCLRSRHPMLAVGAQSSLTGGATPSGDLVVATDRLNDLRSDGTRIHVGAGVPLQTVQDVLAPGGRWFPPVPTYLGAFAGGAVATGAAGAATFKYGTVRPWVEAMTVVLAGGDVIEMHRGEYMASEAGTFEIDTSSGTRIVRLPPLTMPDVPKSSAGYFVKPGMDLLDLFIGSEGTLGIIANVALNTAPLPAGLCRAFVPVPDEAAGISLVSELREASIATWRSRDPNGIDIASIEHLDARSIAVLREDGVDRRLDIAVPAGTAMVLLIDIELPPAAAVRDQWQVIESALDQDAADAPLTRLCRLLDRHGLLDDAEITLPGDRSRAAAYSELREALPAGVNRRVGQARHRDGSVSKTAADMIVPFPRFAEMMAACRRLFAERDLDLAVWGHISDGNVHPNVIPRSAADVEQGREAILSLGREVIAIGGSPLAEHGVGRNSVKQQLLRQLYGSAAIDAMRAIKLSLDPNGSLASGVIFPTQ